jgi:hypothetical protein
MSSLRHARNRGNRKQQRNRKISHQRSLSRDSPAPRPNNPVHFRTPISNSGQSTTSPQNAPLQNPTKSNLALLFLWPQTC